MSSLSPAEWKQPTPWSAAVFAAKVWGLRIRRAAQDLAPASPLRHTREDIELPSLFSEHRSPLIAEVDHAERDFQLRAAEVVGQSPGNKFELRRLFQSRLRDPV